MELIVLGLFLLLLYGFVRMFAAGMAAITGARHRAYRLLAQKYRGRYESRGLVDPPTVSFTHNGSSVRVGLAPVIPGQPAPPRTRVVVRFPSGLPFRLELMPYGRAAPPQPPKGTRPVRTGHADFDRAHVIQANDPDIAREFLEPDLVRQALANLRRVAPMHGMLVSINPERLLVQVDRNLGLNTMMLDAMVREALVLHDRLQVSVSARLSQGIDVVAAGAATAEDAEGPPECQVCGVPIEGEHVFCTACKTPFHRDCWSFVGGCSTFGCTNKQCASA